MPPRRRADIRAFRNAGAVRRPLGVPDHLVGEEGEAVTELFSLEGRAALYCRSAGHSRT